MTALARLPENAPFPPEEIAQLNRVLGPASATQRTWLSGFLAGLEAAQGTQAAPANPPAARPKLTILFATESGNAEALAMAAKRDAARLGFAPRLLDAANATPASLAGAGTLLVIASTWGEGEAPQRATRFIGALLAGDAPRLDGLRFAVLALGDRAYAKFCETGRVLDERLVALGATRIAPRLECDLDYESPAAAWLTTTLPALRGEDAAPNSVVHVDFGAAAATKANPFQAEITELVNLNSSRSDKQTFHVELSLAGSGLAYLPGDSLGVVPQNDPALVDQVLAAAQLSGDDALRAALTARHDITTLTAHTIRQLADATGNARLAALAADPAALAAYLPGRHVLDLLLDHAASLAPEHLLSALRPLAPRLYSIASSQRANPDEAHILVSAVRYETHGRARGGVASTWLADRRRVGDTLPVYVKANPHFRLPDDPDAPLIMIGPGTGVAPFRAFLQDREASNARGPAWLFFGDRQYSHDFLYQLEWQQHLAAGTLTRLDVAFSRDAPQKRYVQHAMQEQADAVRGWVGDGARLYVCGDQAHMARDVHATLRAILGGEDALDELKAQGRYKLDVVLMNALSKNEGIKARSELLRGGIAQGLSVPQTGALDEDDTQLTKFHGIYQQDDRDLRPERGRKRMEPAYSFMARLRIPGGNVTPAQWLALDNIARIRANGSIRLTTRETIQYHGIIKGNLRPAIAAVNDALLDTIAACGDVNRNVMAAVNPHASLAHAEALALAHAISDGLLPKSRAWHEIWLGETRVAGGEEEPMYGPTYLPRKFKIAIAVPPQNDVDVYAHDLGFIAHVDNGGAVTGWDVTVGGGMGMTHGEPDTFPRTADHLGWCSTEEAVDVARAVLMAQRDHGNRAVRKHARLKYTIERMGLLAFQAAVEAHLGRALPPPRGARFVATGDRPGWYESADGLSHFGLFVENGRLAGAALDGLREVASVHRGAFVLTPNQNLVIAGVQDRGAIEALLASHGLDRAASPLRQASMACVALPTCGLALAESERYLPRLLDAIEAAGLAADEVVVRMTGCPNGCARPYLAEIGLVGRGPGRYHLYLGAAPDGTRLNKLYRRDLDHDGILAAVTPLLRDYAVQRNGGERFGDWVIRAGHVAPTTAGNRFHEDTP